MNRTTFVVAANQYGKTFCSRRAYAGYRFLRFWLFVSILKATQAGAKSAADLYEPTERVFRAAEKRGFL